MRSQTSRRRFTTAWLPARAARCRGVCVCASGGSAAHAILRLAASREGVACQSGREVHSQFSRWLSRLATRGGAGVSVLLPLAHLPQPNGLESAICSKTSALQQNSMTFGGQASYLTSVARCGQDDVYSGAPWQHRPSRPPRQCAGGLCGGARDGAAARHRAEEQRIRAGMASFWQPCAAADAGASGQHTRPSEDTALTSALCRSSQSTHCSDPTNGKWHT